MELSAWESFGWNNGIVQFDTFFFRLVLLKTWEEPHIIEKAEGGLHVCGVVDGPTRHPSSINDGMEETRNSEGSLMPSCCKLKAA